MKVLSAPPAYWKDTPTPDPSPQGGGGWLGQCRSEPFNRASLLAAALLAVTLAAPAFAEGLPIDGAYGNAEGCEFHGTGRIVSDAQLLLTPTEVSSSASSCDRLTLVAEEDGRFEVDGLCHEEGEIGAVPTRFTISRNPDATYMVRFDDLSVWGPLGKCP